MFNDEVQHGTTTTTSLVNRIIGGTKVGNPSNPNVNYPYYMVSVQTSNGHYCGGSLIAQDVVLTAAHCYTPHLTKVVVGRYNMSTSEDGEEIMIVGKLRHPNHNNEYMITDNDFMLIFLQRAVAATTSTTSATAAAAANNIIIKPIKLNSNTSYPSPNQYATSLGWGDTNIRDNYWNDDDDDDDDTTINDYYTSSDVLKTVELQIVSNIDCENSENLHVNGRTYNYTNQITDNMICAKGRYRRSGPCYGDSGGPLIIVKSNNNNNNNNDDDDDESDVLLVGVVSGAISCATDQFPEIFARVSVAYEWIHCVLCERSEYAINAGFDCNDDDRRSSSITSTTIIDCPAVTAYPTYSPTYLASGSSSSSSSSIALEDIPATATTTTCLTEMECKAKSGGYTRYTVGDYPFYGCFTKGGNLFWGKGGTVEQIMSEDRTFNKATKVFC
jgi:trypsin